jgi:phosphoribosylaminoimidazolecarboxamide formyltransferase/IMP cyclohydrolase
VVSGMLLQDRDISKTKMEDWQVVTQRQPTADEYRALDFAWRVQHVKSNAIVLAKSDQVSA